MCWLKFSFQPQGFYPGSYISSALMASQSLGLGIPQLLLTACLVYFRVALQEKEKPKEDGGREKSMMEGQALKAPSYAT